MGGGASHPPCCKLCQNKAPPQHPTHRHTPAPLPTRATSSATSAAWKSLMSCSTPSATPSASCRQAGSEGRGARVGREPVGGRSQWKGGGGGRGRPQCHPQRLVQARGGSSSSASPPPPPATSPAARCGPGWRGARPRRQVVPACAASAPAHPSVPAAAHNWQGHRVGDSSFSAGSCTRLGRGRRVWRGALAAAVVASQRLWQRQLGRWQAGSTCRCGRGKREKWEVPREHGPEREHTVQG